MTMHTSTRGPRAPSLLTAVKCPKCQGTGRTYGPMNATGRNEWWVECKACRGRGKVKVSTLMEGGDG